MVDVLEAQDKTEDSAPAAMDAAKAVVFSKEVVLSKPSKKTMGYRIHNEMTYRVIDWLLNSTFGVSVAVWTERMPSGAKFKNFLESKFETILKPILKGESLKEGARWSRRFVSIMAGGFTIIPLMMFMENKQVKKGLVRKMDEVIYGKDTVANDPRFQEVYGKIDEEPKKGFWVGMASRILTLIPLLVVTFTKKLNDPVDKYFYRPTGEVTKWIAKKAGIKPRGFLDKTVEGIAEKDDPHNWDFLHHMIGFDFGLTFLYAFMHEATYKAMAALGVKQEKPAQPKADSSSSPNIAVVDAEQDTQPAKWAGAMNTAAKTRPEPAASHVQAMENRSSGDSLGMA